MSSLPVRERFPRAPLIGAVGMILVTLVSVALSRVSGVGASRLEPAHAIASLDVRFEDRVDGSVAVLNGSGERTVLVLEAGAHGFVRGVLRGFARERRAAGISEAPPFRLARLNDGRLLIEDTASGRRIDLDAFGPTNVAAFVKILETGIASR
jgi:putative photosynthetic complex assembly protein